MAKSPACISCGRTDRSFGKGKAGQCNHCYKIEWEITNPIKLRAQRLYGNAQKRCRQKGWSAPDFDSAWIYDKIINGYCEVTGIPFDLYSVTNDSVHAKNPWVPSLDRIDSSKPYSKDNVQVVVFMYNVCKAEFNHDDVITFCKSILRQEAEIG